MKLSRDFFRRNQWGDVAGAIVLGIGIVVQGVQAQDAGFGLSAPDAPKTLNIDFPGGSPEQFGKVLKAATGKSPNMVIPRELRRVEIPELSLRNVTLDQVFETLNYLGEKRGLWRSLKSGGGSDKVWVLQGRSANRETRIFQLKQFLGSYSIEDISTAIQSGWELKSDLTGEPSGEMRFHEETSLLFVVASSSQLNTVKEILEQLLSPIMEDRALNEALELQQAQVRDLELVLRDEARAKEAELRELLAINEEKLVFKDTIQQELEVRLKEMESRFAELQAEALKLETEYKLREIDLMSERDRQLRQSELNLKAAQDALEKTKQ